jgi:hypothetical protein
MKSNANLHLPSGLGTIRTWLHIGAWLASMTPRQSKASTCSLIAVCISMLWCQGGSRLRETFDFPLSTTIITGSTLSDWCLTLIEKKTMYFSQSFLGFAWNPTEPSKRIMANHSYRVSVFWSSPFDVIIIVDGIQHITFFRRDRMSQVAEGRQMGWHSNTPVHRAGLETDQVSSSIWSPRQHQSKYNIQVWTQAELPDCFDSATQSHRSMKEVCVLGDGTYSQAYLR